MYYLTYMRFFIDYLIERYDETVAYIKNDFLHKCEFNGMRLSSRQLTDASVCLDRSRIFCCNTQPIWDMYIMLIYKSKSTSGKKQ